MILNSDSYFSQGSSHKICQDYCLHGTANKGYTEFAILSDGCSSSMHTDVGSRVLVHSSILPIYYAIDNVEIFEKDLLKDAVRAQRSLYLENQCLDATLFHLCVDNDHAISTYKKYVLNAHGDGAFIKITNDNIINFTYIEYPSGAPLYINYHNDPERFESYKQEYGLQRKIYRYTIKDGLTINFKLETDESGRSFREIGICDNYKALIVTSDGIASFMRTSVNKPVELITLINNLIDFKSYKGEFIQRRMNGFNHLCEKQGWKHLDDLSLAGIHISND